MNRSGLSNSGELTVIRLERSEYDTADDISGTVELSNAQRKDITGIVLELTSWRHISLKSGKSGVEQLSRQALELFPNLSAGGDRRYGHDEKVLRTNAMFTFIFTAQAKEPTLEFSDLGRIKHYLTCYVYKKSGLLSRERIIEKNQFQILLKAAHLEVDSVYPDRVFSSIASRPHPSNDEQYAFQARCSTHVMPGLPLLVELEMAVDVEINSVVLSLHQSTSVSLGAEQEEHDTVSRYVHEVTWPRHRTEGHFRSHQSIKPLAHGKRSWLIEWTCPEDSSRLRLPFESTFYSKTAEGKFERSLTLKVEVELRRSATKLTAILHHLNFHRSWTDSRSEKAVSLRHERSVTRSSPNASVRGENVSFDVDSSRRNSILSVHSANSGHKVYHQGPVTQVMGHHRQPSPAASPHYSSSRVPSGHDYFSQSGRGRASTGQGSPQPEVKLTHGSYSPGAVQLMGRADSVRSNASSRPGKGFGAQPFSTNFRSSRPAPEKLSLPPASVRSSMSSAFESLNMRNSPSTSLSSPTRRQFDELPRTTEQPAPPPSQPLPPAPQPLPGTGVFRLGDGNTSPYASSVTDSLEENVQHSSRVKKPTRLSRPAVILGVSQDTIQVHESLPTPPGGADGLNGLPRHFATSPQIAGSGFVGGAPQGRPSDRDSGFSETSYNPASPIVGRGSQVVTSSGYAMRKTQQTAPDDGGRVLLG